MKTSRAGPLCASTTQSRIPARGRRTFCGSRPISWRMWSSRSATQHCRLAPRPHGERRVEGLEEHRAAARMAASPLQVVVLIGIVFPLNGSRRAAAPEREQARRIAGIRFAIVSRHEERGFVGPSAPGRRPGAAAHKQRRVEMHAAAPLRAGERLEQHSAPRWRQARGAAGGSWSASASRNPRTRCRRIRPPRHPRGTRTPAAVTVFMKPIAM